MDQCGEASAATKLSALSLQDRSLLTAKKKQIIGHGAFDDKAEYFEFADENSWANEFKTMKKSVNKPLISRELPMFEDVFNKAKLQTSQIPVTSSDWIKDFKNQRQIAVPTDDFEKFNKIFDSIASNDRGTWEKEFSKHEITQDKWTDEFKEAETTMEDNGISDDSETAKSARILLESLDLTDPKLASSKFVAYLKELTENDPTINGTFSAHQEYNWEKEFHKSMDAAGLAGDIEDDQWRNLEKAWDKYEFSGQGYEQFAPKEFAQYRYSIDDLLNPFHGLSSETIKFELHGLKARDLSKYILALEELTRLRPDDGDIWKDLGLAQAENELDVQAIAAFYRAVQCDSRINSAWMGLGAACVNEYCIPDALDAFKRIASNYLGDSVPPIDQSNQLNSLISIFRSSLLIPDEEIRVGVLSVLLNVSGEHDEAITLLQNSSSKLNDHSVWNRLGATLANSQRYEEALRAYEMALNLNPTYVRALYNMSVSYMNQSNYPKAIAYMVRALQYHLPVTTQIDVGNVSEALRTGYNTIWNTMRIVGDMWGREDISVLIEERNLSAIMNILKEVL